jgi:hypothetical protein
MRYGRTGERITGTAPERRPQADRCLTLSFSQDSRRMMSVIPPAWCRGNKGVSSVEWACWHRQSSNTIDGVTQAEAATSHTTMAVLRWSAEQLIDKAVSTVARSVFEAAVQSAPLENPGYGPRRVQLERRAESWWLS